MPKRQLLVLPIQFFLRLFQRLAVRIGTNLFNCRSQSLNIFRISSVSYAVIVYNSLDLNYCRSNGCIAMNVVKELFGSENR